MATANEYLKKILASNNLKNDAEEINKVRDEKSNVEKAIKDAYPEAKKTIRYGGSYAKNTMVKENYDLDILCYFHEGENSAGTSLEEIYNNIKDCLADTYFVQPKKSALRLKNKDNKNDFHIDVVPGRFVEKDNGDAYLYQNGVEQNRLKTNPDKHISYIKDSGLTDVIKLLKIWKNKNGLELKTFVLELLTIEVLKERKDKSLSDNLKFFWEEMRDNVDSISIEDPANQNNDLSEMFNKSTKEAIKEIAELALDSVDSDNWENIFGPAEDKDSNKTENDDKKRKIETFASSVGVAAKPYVELQR